MRASERRYYDLLAPEYEDWALAQGLYASSEPAGWRDELDRLIELISTLRAARILDVACGTGIFTRHLRGSVVGVDQSEAMLDEARRRCPGASFVLGDALELPFPNESFDVVFTAHFYGHLLPDDRKRFLAEAKRVAPALVLVDSALRPGVASEGVRVRVLRDGSTHHVFKRFFRASDLAEELGGEELFGGDWFVAAGRGPGIPGPIGGPATQRILAVDAGSSKTEAALVTVGGELLGAARGAGIPYTGIGLPAAMRRLAATVTACCMDASLAAAPRPIASLGVYCLAGADLADNRRALTRALAEWTWSAREVLRNDTFAMLRAGTDRPWGVAVVCGAGINCLGVHPSGRTVRFPAAGWASGDAGGGYWLGKEAVAAAVRGRDGRGRRTALERLVPEHFGLSRPSDIAAAIRAGRLRARRVVELPPLVFAAAQDGDAVARALLDGLADEVVVTATAVLRRLGLVRSDAEVILGGGLFRNGDERFHDRIRRGIEAAAPRAHVVTLEAPPVLGAALLGLDELAANPEAGRRLRRALDGGFRPT